MKRPIDLLIIGTVPPPIIGGVTMYNSRLLGWMKDEGLACSQIDVKKVNALTVLRKIASSKLCHISLSHQYAILILVIVCIVLRTKSVFTLHRDLNRYGKTGARIISIAAKFAKCIIVLNDSSFEKLKKYNKNTRLIGTNIPPVSTEILPEDVRTQLRELRSQSEMIVVTNAFGKIIEDGVEIYGIYELIKFFTGRSERLIILDPSGEYKTDVAKQYGDTLAPNITIIGKRISFHAVLEYADVFIRNTSTDGDSLSVHEGLQQGVVVWATDVVSRPNGTNLFKSLSEIDLTKRQEKQSFGSCDVDKIKSLYSELSS